jgi:AcrR family transcriptional regulator
MNRKSTGGSADPLNTNERLASSEAILNAAERVFASYGYEGATMKRIAQEAGMAQGLLHYYFHTKENLYEAVFERRSSVINAYRERAIDQLFATQLSPSLEDLLEIFLYPAAAILGLPDGSGSAFSQIVAAIVVSGDDRSKSMMIRYYDPIAHRFIAAFQRLLPDLRPADAVWSYLFAHGARMNLYARNDRASRLAKNSRDATFEQGLTRLRAFTAAGIRQLATQNATDRTRKPAPGRPPKAQQKKIGVWRPVGDRTAPYNPSKN